MIFPQHISSLESQHRIFPFGRFFCVQWKMVVNESGGCRWRLGATKYVRRIGKFYRIWDIGHFPQMEQHYVAPTPTKSLTASNEYEMLCDRLQQTIYPNLTGFAPVFIIRHITPYSQSFQPVPLECEICWDFNTNQNKRVYQIFSTSFPWCHSRTHN